MHQVVSGVAVPARPISRSEDGKSLARRASGEEIEFSATNLEFATQTRCGNSLDVGLLYENFWMVRFVGIHRDRI
jgi:hypothetical protein